MQRRRFASVAAAAPFVARFALAKGKFEPDYATAEEALEALQSRAISSVELTRHVFARIKRHNPAVNAFVTLNEEHALRDASKADRARGTRGRLHGLPISVKDAYATAGLRTTAGSKSLEKYVPVVDAAAVAKLRAAGAILVGKTNLPEWSADLQAYNDVAGTTNNPYGFTRTCGGSTGGGAAATASGFNYLELGSDSGGSIRIPAHFCGVYGHKSTVNLVSRNGWMPPMPGEFRGPNDWSVAGPLARSAADLRILLEVAAGPVDDDAVAYRWSPPAPRRKSLKQYKIGYVLDDPLCPVSSEVSNLMAAFLDALGKAGPAKLQQGWPAKFDFAENFRVFQFLTTAFQTATFNAAAKAGLEAERGGPFTELATAALEAVTTSYAEWEKRHVRRLELRKLWQTWFGEFDLFLMPVAMVAAFPHDHSMPRHRRLIETPEGKRPYNDMSPWISVGGLNGCPVTVAPIGHTKLGLPVGVQIMGPFLEDLTPIHFAGLLGAVSEGYRRPELLA